MKKSQLSKYFLGKYMENWDLSSPQAIETVYENIIYYQIYNPSCFKNRSTSQDQTPYSDWPCHTIKDKNRVYWSSDKFFFIQSYGIQLLLFESSHSAFGATFSSIPALIASSFVIPSPITNPFSDESNTFIPLFPSNPRVLSESSVCCVIWYIVFLVK